MAGAVQRELSRVLNCPIPDDCIEYRRYPLFLARSGMRGSTWRQRQHPWRPAGLSQTVAVRPAPCDAVGSRQRARLPVPAHPNTGRLCDRFGHNAATRGKASNRGSWEGASTSPGTPKAAVAGGRPALGENRPPAASQISVCSEISSASSTSMPRYRTVDSSLEGPSSSYPARRFLVRR